MPAGAAAGRFRQRLTLAEWSRGPGPDGYWLLGESATGLAISAGGDAQYRSGAAVVMPGPVVVAACTQAGVACLVTEFGRLALWQLDFDSGQAEKLGEQNFGVPVACVAVSDTPLLVAVALGSNEKRDKIRALDGDSLSPLGAFSLDGYVWDIDVSTDPLFSRGDQPGSEQASCRLNTGQHTTVLAVRMTTWLQTKKRPPVQIRPADPALPGGPVGGQDVNVEAVMPGERQRLRVQRDRLARSDALAAQAGRRLPREFLGELDDQRLHGGGLLWRVSAPGPMPNQRDQRSRPGDACSQAYTHLHGLRQVALWPAAMSSRGRYPGILLTPGGGPTQARPVGDEHAAVALHDDPPGITPGSSQAARIGRSAVPR